MITSAVRTLEVGTTGLVWARITDDYAQDLTGLDVQLRTVSPLGVVSEWAAPEDTAVPAVGQFRAALLHTAVVLGWWKLQARITDNPEVIVLTAAFQVVDPLA
jgi:hypothetical protein